MEGYTAPRRTGGVLRRPKLLASRRRIVMEKSLEELYGLEPLFEPATQSEANTPLSSEAAEIDCPYCGERIAVVVDLSAGAQSYIEDCSVCCQPMTLELRFSPAGDFVGIEVERSDR